MLFEVAPAQHADIEILYACNRALIEIYEDTDTIDLAHVLAWIRRKLEGHIEEYSRILVDGEVAGFFRFALSEDAMELDDLYILPAYQNRGLATALIRSLVSTTALPVFLYVFRENRGAVRLYERLGFRVTEEVSPTRYIMTRLPTA